MPRLVHRRWLVLVILGLSGLLGFLHFYPWRQPVAAANVSVKWTYEPVERGAFMSSPTVADDKVYAAAIHDTAFSNLGAVYCLNATTGKPIWRFDDDGKMQHMYSSPCLADGRLYIGEGMHANFVCKLYCLDAATGKKLWHFVAGGHIESTPCAGDGKVYFGAGDDGIYCLDATTGEKCWQFQGPYHVDSSPALAGTRLFAGSGVSRTRRTTEAFCLDTRDGNLVWRVPADLPVWGSPALAGDDVFFGLGNGRLAESAQPPEKPAGALLCLAAATGEQRWRFDVDDALLARVTVGAECVFFGARDAVCYALDRRTGQLRWKQNLGSPIITSPALVAERLYVVASGGRICCLDARRGLVEWTFDVGKHSQTRPHLYSSPAVVDMPLDHRSQRLIFFGSELRSVVSSAAVMYCLQERPAN